MDSGEDAASSTSASCLSLTLAVFGDSKETDACIVGEAFKREVREELRAAAREVADDEAEADDDEEEDVETRDEDDVRAAGFFAGTGAGDGF